MAVVRLSIAATGTVVVGARAETGHIGAASGAVDVTTAVEAATAEAEAGSGLGISDTRCCGN
jgi:hypothetical protein